MPDPFGNPDGSDLMSLINALGLGQTPSPLMDTPPPIDTGMGMGSPTASPAEAGMAAAQVAPSAAPQLPELPHSSSVFNTPYIGPVLDVARGLVVGPGAENLTTREQVTRGILNTIVLAHNPGALGTMYGNYAAQDDKSISGLASPMFKQRVNTLVTDYHLSEAAAIQRAAQEYNISNALDLPTSIGALPATPSSVQLKYNKTQEQVKQQQSIAGAELPDIPPFSGEFIKQALNHQSQGITLIGSEPDAIAAYQRWNTGRMPGMNVDKTTVTSGGKSTTTYTPNNMLQLGPRGEKLNPYNGQPMVEAPPVQPQGPGATAAPASATGVPPGIAAPTGVPAGMPAAPGTAGAPTGSPVPLADAARVSASPLTSPDIVVQLPNPNTNTIDNYVIPKSPEQAQKDYDRYMDFKERERIEALKTANYIIRRNADLRTKRVNRLMTNEEVTQENMDTATTIVGDYERDPNGKPLIGPDGQPKGVGLYQFLNPKVFGLTEINEPDTLMGEITGLVKGIPSDVTQYLRRINTRDPDNIDLARYDPFVNERVPAYLAAAGVKRTSQAEINLLKQAFPNPSTMPLRVAIKMAAQLPSIMAARAAIARQRVKEAESGQTLTPYPDINLNIDGRKVVVLGGNPSLDGSKPTMTFLGGTEETTPEAAPAAEADDESAYLKSFKGSEE